MNSKERITIAMSGGTPDCVPVTLGLSEMVPVRYFTDDYIEFFWKAKIPLWRARVETEHDRLGGDAFLHLAESPSPHDPPVEMKNVQETKDRVTFTRVIHTPEGDLEADFFLARQSCLSNLTNFVKNPEADAAKVLAMLEHPDTKNLEPAKQAYREIGDRGHVGFWVSTPIDWWTSLRGAQNMVMDLMDYPELMQRLFYAYTEYAATLVDYVLEQTQLDSVGLGGSSTSMNVINPELHRTHSLSFGKAICQVAHQHGRSVQYHMCGRSRQALPITAEMGVDGFDALESPPTGNVDLAEVKKTFGGRISLRGNVNSIAVMLEGTPEEVDRGVRRCMEAAKAGGGYILGVGDQTPYNTPDENLHAFVDAGKKYGKY